jgi:3-methyladenine DNA glycosylase/8-oxoguanine DNA glycosylase
MTSLATPTVISAEAIAHLSARDPVLAGVIASVGVFEPPHEPDLWWSLVDAIVSQQLSVKAAATIAGRVAALGSNGSRPSPETILATADDTLRACGLSRAKVVYVKDLAARWSDGRLNPARLVELQDGEVVAELIAVKGIGRWTAEMFLIFTLGRPDILPVDDLGLRTAVHRAYNLAERPAAAEVARIGERWKPFSSAATLYLWRSLKNG